MPYCAVLSEVLFNPTASHTHLAYILELVLVAENASDIFQNTSELLWLHVSFNSKQFTKPRKNVQLCSSVSHRSASVGLHGSRPSLHLQQAPPDDRHGPPDDRLHHLY